MAIAAVLERFPNPPLTRAMLGVLDHDDHLDPRDTAEALGLTLTSVGPDAESLSELGVC